MKWLVMVGCMMLASVVQAQETGPWVSCWNTQGGWNLKKQVELIKAGVHYAPMINVPLLSQGANNPARWQGFLDENAAELEYLNSLKEPVYLRTHNIGNDLMRLPREPYPLNALVNFRKADGSIEDSKVLDSLAPVKPWADLGVEFANCWFMQQLKVRLPDVDVVLIENNEAADTWLGDITKVTNVKDQYGYKVREFLPGLDKINLRASEFVGTVDELETKMLSNLRAQYRAFQDSFRANVPWKVTFAGYAGISASDGLINNQIYRREKIQWKFDMHSVRCYDDGSGSPVNWHYYPRGAHALQMCMIGENNDHMSLWMSPQRTRVGGYIKPPVVKGFSRFALWADLDHGDKVACWFADSKQQMTDTWWDGMNDPPELKHYTHGDFFQTAVDAVEEVWKTPLLLELWRKGEPILSPDPHVMSWLPPVENRFLTNSVRFVDGKDTWRAADGQVVVGIHALAWKLGDRVVIYAWSPKGVTDDVVLPVPGVGNVELGTVDQDGTWKVNGWTTLLD